MHKRVVLEQLLFLRRKYRKVITGYRERYGRNSDIYLHVESAYFDVLNDLDELINYLKPNRRRSQSW